MKIKVMLRKERNIKYKKKSTIVSVTCFTLADKNSNPKKLNSFFILLQKIE